MAKTNNTLQTGTLTFSQQGDIANFIPIADRVRITAWWEQQ